MNKISYSGPGRSATSSGRRAAYRRHAAIIGAIAGVSHRRREAALEEERAVCFDCNIGAALAAVALAGVTLSGSMAVADTVPTHRIPAALAIEAAIETVSACAKQGYHETALVLDADGATIVALRGMELAFTPSIARTTRRTPPSPSRTILSPWPSVRRARIRLRLSSSCRTSCSLAAALSSNSATRQLALIPS